MTQENAGVEPESMEAPSYATVEGINNSISFSGKGRPPKSVKVLGNDNSVSIANSAELAGATLSIRGNRNTVNIANGCVIKGAIYIKGSDCVVSIGAKTTIVGFRATVAESTSLHIGEDCMFSRNIEIRTTDEHPIFDRSTRQVINPGKSVRIGDHVWIGQGVQVTKGGVIPNGCVIGTGSIVTGALATENCVYAGVPAVLRRDNIYWARSKRSAVASGFFDDSMDSPVDDSVDGELDLASPENPVLSGAD